MRGKSMFTGKTRTVWVASLSLALVHLASACATTAGNEGNGATPVISGSADSVAFAIGECEEQPSLEVFLSSEKALIDSVVERLVGMHGQKHETAIRRGVEQVATFWTAVDGPAEVFQAFCIEHYLADSGQLKSTLDRFDRNLEAVYGHAVALGRILREPMDVDIGEQYSIDLLFASLNPFDHFSDDAFRTKVAFVALLNFPLYSLDELMEKGPSMDREEWAAARLTKGFSLRVPGYVKQDVTKAYAQADDYISHYNIHMGNVVDDEGNKLFPGLGRLISHWGLRDHIKSLYSDPLANVEKQKLTVRIMERVVAQEIPELVISNPGVLWNPQSNNVWGVSPDSEPVPIPDAAREPDRRYAYLLEIFRAETRVDEYALTYPTFIERRFNFDREMPEENVEALLESILVDPVAKEVAAIMQERLGRPLEPFDIWYDGFKVGAHIPDGELDKVVSERYDSVDSFGKDLPNILKAMGFAEEKADYIASKIVVEPARGAGHAIGAGMRSDSSHLRTRVPKDGMNYKGYNIALHELGHNVEQVFSLDKVDRVLMAGVPNTAFTEAFAFMFQSQDMELLGVSEQDPHSLERQMAAKTLDAYWSTFEIAGVALLEMRTWRHMYQHPTLTPAELRDFVVKEAKNIWNQYYAPVLGVEDSTILGIYSHMIFIGLYLPDYPVGMIIDFQISEFMAQRDMAEEMERMCSLGKLSPDAWMRAAVGNPVSGQPMVQATRKAVEIIRNDKVASTASPSDE